MSRNRVTKILRNIHRTPIQIKRSTNTLEGLTIAGLAPLWTGELNGWQWKRTNICALLCSLDRTPQRHWICPCQPLEAGCSAGPWWSDTTARAGYMMTTRYQRCPSNLWGLQQYKNNGYINRNLTSCMTRGNFSMDLWESGECQFWVLLCRFLWFCRESDSLQNSKQHSDCINHTYSRNNWRVFCIENTSQV